jgi:hypothetical protein
MSYIVVENFSAGLDTRKHPLTAKPGTLQTLKNAHVSRGGEIEKRKKFATFASLPAGTFGMEAADSTIYVFGSASTPAGIPAGVTYQRLQHPDAIYSMTEVVYSTLYGGYPFVIAKFSNGSVYPFWNGTIIGDFVNGVARSGMSLAQLAASISSSVNSASNGYTSTSASGVVSVTGPAGVEWEPSYTVDSPLTVSTAVTQTRVEAVSEINASGSFSINGGTPSTRGSVPYRTLSTIDTATLPGITGVYSRNPLSPSLWSPVAVTSPVYYNSTLPAYIPIGIATPTVPAERLAYVIASFVWAYALNYESTYGPYTAYAASYGISNTQGTFMLFSPLLAATTYNTWETWIEFTADPSSVTGIAQLIEPATIIASPITAGRFIGRVGVLTGGTYNAVSSVRVDGVEVMNGTNLLLSSYSALMQSIVTTINTFTSSVEYTASFSDGNVVITAIAGAGASANGRVISVQTIGNVTVGTIFTMANGRTEIAPQSNVVNFTIAGTPSSGNKVTIISTPALDSSNPLYWGATRVSNTTPVSAMTFKTKAHVTSGSSLFFSGVNQPTKWGNNGTGAGFINLSNNSGGNEALTSLALYQGQLAAFARRSIQLWAIDTDPANNRQGQILSNTGTFAANSVMSIGEIDVFYLSDSGVRSLRARDASNAAVVNDVGTPIDNLILTEISTLSEAQKAACCAIIEPIDGRYWLAIGSKVYVYSYFPNSQVAAWSIYEPGFTVSKFTTKDGRVYARSGNVIYLYGGTNNAEYDSSTVEVILPYLDGGKPAHQKTLNGLDMTVEGSWQVFIGMDPIAVNARDDCGTITQPTFSLGRIMANGTGTHVGIRMVNSSAGYARIANIIAHFEANESN